MAKTDRQKKIEYIINKKMNSLMNEYFSDYSLCDEDEINKTNFERIDAEWKKYVLIINRVHKKKINSDEFKRQIELIVNREDFHEQLKKSNK